MEIIPRVENEGNDHRIVVSDVDGVSHEWTVNQENSREVLRELMDIEKAKDSYDYEERQKLLVLSEGKIMTHEAFTKDSWILEAGYPQLQLYLKDRTKWLDERNDFQDQLLEEQQRAMEELSDRLENEKPTLYLLRGNTASGKTSVLKRYPRFKKIINPKTNMADGVLNTDTIKKSMREKSGKRNGKYVITHNQCHEEAVMLTNQLEDNLIDSPELSLVIDRRYAYRKQLTVTIDRALAHDKDVEILDLDVPLEISLLRVLFRDPEGEDPCVPFNSVMDGFTGIRKFRRGLIQTVKHEPRIKYYLLAESGERPIEPIAEKSDGEYVIKNDVLAEECVIVDQGEVDELKEKVIDDRYITYVIRGLLRDYPVEEKPRILEIMKNNRGKTLAEALDFQAKVEKK